MMEDRGTVDKSDYDEFIPLLEDLIAKHGKVNCVADLRSLESITAEALLEKLKLSYKYRDNVSRYAIVDLKPSLVEFAEIAALLSKGELKTFNKDDFNKDELDQAWRWINEG